MGVEQIMDPNVFVSSLIGEYGRELENLWKDLPGGMFNPLESLALYSLIRYSKPKSVLEVGSLLGKSTSIIQQALEYNESGRFTSCDLEGRSAMTRRNLNKLFPENNIIFLSGPIETHLSDIGETDFLFIDGPHDDSFMQWCIDNLVSKLKKKSWVLIHDINLSYNWNYRDTPKCETECLMRLEMEHKLPLQKAVWMEDWCLNHHLKELRNAVYADFPMVGKWGILDHPEGVSLSIWLKKDLDDKNISSDSNK
jgi:predicted O-methyltransferase YrrM